MFNAPFYVNIRSRPKSRVLLINFLGWNTPLVLYTHIRKYLFIFSFNKLSFGNYNMLPKQMYCDIRSLQVYFPRLFYYLNSDTPRHKGCIIYKKKCINLKEYSKWVKRTNKQKNLNILNQCMKPRTGRE